MATIRLMTIASIAVPVWKPTTSKTAAPASEPPKEPRLEQSSQILDTCPADAESVLSDAASVTSFFIRSKEPSDLVQRFLFAEKVTLTYVTCGEAYSLQS